MSLLPTAKHLRPETTTRSKVPQSREGLRVEEEQHTPGVVSPVDAGGLIIRAVVALIQHKGVKLTLLPRGVVHQSHVPLGDYKLPVRVNTTFEFELSLSETKEAQSRSPAIR